MTKPIVLFDCDGVLADLATTWFDYHNRDCTVCLYPLTLAMVTEWDTSKFVACGTNIYSYLRNVDLWHEIRPMPGSLHALNHLSKSIRPVVVTSVTQGRAHQAARIDWIRSYFPMIDPGDIVITNKKACVGGDLLIDDALHNLDGFPGDQLVFDHPYNRSDRSIPRVASWEGVEWWIHRWIKTRVDGPGGAHNGRVFSSV